MSYTAVSCPAGYEERTKSGFNTKEEAWMYVQENHICNTCLGDLKDGGFSVKLDDGSDDWVEITHVCSTMCGAEWEVVTDEEWKENK